MSHLRPGQTLQPTDLVHEAYVRLFERENQQWGSRGHFYGAAARAMRDILVDGFRRKAARKRGGDRVRIDADGMDVAITLAGNATLGSAELLTLHHALDELQKEHPEHVDVVMLRYFAGLTVNEIAELHGSSKSTVERQWRYARAWLIANMPDMAPKLVNV